PGSSSPRPPLRGRCCRAGRRGRSCWAAATTTTPGTATCPAPRSPGSPPRIAPPRRSWRGCAPGAPRSPACPSRRPRRWRAWTTSWWLWTPTLRCCAAWRAGHGCCTGIGWGWTTGGRARPDWRPAPGPCWRSRPDPPACEDRCMVHVIFHEPAIAGNTGNAIRLAAVTGVQLHLVEPLGFDFGDAKLRRAGLDYHDLAELRIHADIQQALAAVPESRVFAFTARSELTLDQVAYRRDDVLLFGTEPTGLPEEVMDHPRITARVRIPMRPARRSLNLANAASVAVYEAWRQLGYEGAGR